MEGILTKQIGFFQPGPAAQLVSCCQWLMEQQVGNYGCGVLQRSLLSIALSRILCAWHTVTFVISQMLHASMRRQLCLSMCVRSSMASSAWRQLCMMLAILAAEHLALVDFMVVAAGHLRQP